MVNKDAKLYGVSEWLLVNANSAIFQLYLVARTSKFSMRWWWSPICTRPTCWFGFLVLAHWNNSPPLDIELHSDTLFWSGANWVFALSPLWRVLNGEATKNYFKVFGLTRPGLEPTIYHTWGTGGQNSPI